MSNKETRRDSTPSNSVNLNWSSKTKINDMRRSSTSEVLMNDRTANTAKILPPPIARCGSLVSPYDAAVARNWDAKIHSNKVFNIWYKRYAGLLPEGMQFQPFDEIQKREDDIALQYYLGSSYRALENPDDQWSIRQKDAFIRRYSKVRQADEDKRFMKLSPHPVIFISPAPLTILLSDIALQYYLGSSYRALENPEDQWSIRQKDALIEDTVNEPAESMRVLSLRSILATKRAKDQAMKEMFGPSCQERLKAENVCKAFMLLRIKRKRKSIAAQRLKPTSKWHLLKSTATLKRLRSLYRTRLASQARVKFIKIIHTVFHIRNFISVISKLAGDTHSVFSGLKHLKEEREKLLDRSNLVDPSRVKNFNPAHYTFNKEVHLSQEIKLTLTTPCRQRSNEEVDKIVEVLQQIRAFVAYPIAYQKVLAKSAWYIVVKSCMSDEDIVLSNISVMSYPDLRFAVPAFRVVIRERHLAVCCYFMINGRANVQKLAGSAYHLKPGDFKNVRTLRAQDTFGEEAITNPGCLRNYSVTTETTCEMLSVNSHEFQESMLLSSKYETAPEHIRFLGSLNAMRKFPKLKLLEEAEDNINIAHFVSGAVVATDVEKSAYVYFVFYGNCDVLKELPPPHSVVDAYVKKKQLTRTETPILGAVSPVCRKSVFVREAVKKFQEDSDQETLVADQYRTRGSYFASRRDYIESRENLRNVFLKEIEKRQNEYMSYRNAFMAEAHDLEEKCRQISMTMPAAAQMRLMGENITSRRGQDYRQSVKAFKPERNLDHFGDRRISSKPVAKMVSRDVVDGKDDGRKHKVFQSPSARGGTQASSRIVSREFLDSKDDRDDSKMRTSRKYTKIVGSNMNLLDAVFRTSIHTQPEHERSKKASIATPPTEDGSQIALTNSQRRSQMFNFSRWALVKTAIRGDVMGTEYLDFRSEPFEPPKEVRSIVTAGGATIIMVKKSFLLKYLRKEW